MYAIRPLSVSGPHPSEDENEEVDANLGLVVVVDPRTTVRLSLRMNRRQNWPQKVVGGDEVRIMVAFGCGELVGGLWLFDP